MREIRTWAGVRSAVVVAMAATVLSAAGWGQVSVPAGMRKEVIADPVLGMTAFEVMVPSKWHFAGRLLQGSTCSPVPFPVFRTTSPDGLSVLERLPAMSWSWGNGPGVGAKDCLPLHREMSAKEFAKYVAGMLKADYVSDDPYPASVVDATNKAFEDAKAANAARYQAAGMNPPTEHTDMDRVVVQFKNGTFTMKGLIAVSIYCAGNRSRQIGNLPVMETHNCTANVRYVHAPEAKYAEMVAMLQSAGAAQKADWTKAWNDENNRQAQANIRGIQERGAQDQARMQASHEQFMQSQASRQRTHEAFMASMQRGTDMSMNRAREGMNARSTATSNVVDYALDQQTVRDPNSGQVNKVSSSYSYTWVDTTGRTSYQTNDPNANPNGSLQGNWTRQQVVNGDGSQPQ